MFQRTVGRQDAPSQWRARARVSLGVKMFGGIAAILVISLAVGIVSIGALTYTVAQFEAIDNDDAALQDAVHKTSTGITGGTSIIDAVTSGRLDPSGADLRQRRAELEDATRRLQARVTDPTSQRRAAEMVGQASAYFDALA